jgi:hypothetical protein
MSFELGLTAIVTSEVDVVALAQDRELHDVETLRFPSTAVRAEARGAVNKVIHLN